MIEIPRKFFKYEINESVWQRNREGDMERTTITERQVINGENYYCTDLLPRWQHEDFIK